MKELDQMIRSLGEAVGKLNIALNLVDEYSHNINVYYGGIERMKNCVNCEHFEVCVVVHDRKRRQAGDYSPCGKWKLVEK